MLQQAIGGLKKLWAITGVLDQLVVCVQCRDVVRVDRCKVNCTCASSKVYKRWRQCWPVHYCPNCHDALRTDAGDPIPEMRRDLWE